MRIVGILIACLGIFAPAASGSEANAGRYLPHFKHASFTIEDGTPDSIQAIAQGGGYLWMGGNGVFRFDGVSFERIPFPQTLHRRSDLITALLVDTSGQLWIGHDYGGVSVFKNGEVRDANAGQKFGGLLKFVEDSAGGIWAASNSSSFVALSLYANGKWESPQDTWGLPNEVLTDLMKSSDGTLWATLDHSLAFMHPGSKHFELATEKIVRGTHLAEARNGDLLLAGPLGIRTISSSGPRIYARSKEIYSFPDGTGSTGISVDSLGHIWISNSSVGVVEIDRSVDLSKPEVNQDTISVHVFSRDWLTASRILSQAVDREGDFWVATVMGLDRFNPVDVVVALSDPPMSVNNGFAVVSDGPGNVYAINGGKLYGIQPTEDPVPLQTYTPKYNLLCGSPAGGAWVPDKGDMVRVGFSTPVRIAISAELASAEFRIRCKEDTSGGLWISAQGGVYFRGSSNWQNFILMPTVKKAPAFTMEEDGRGRMLAYVGNGAFVRIDGSKVEEIYDRKHVPLDFINVIYRSGSGAILGGAKGLARLDEQLAVLPSNEYPFLSGVNGIWQSAHGETWLFADVGLIRLDTHELNAAFDMPGAALHPRVFDSQDGLLGGTDDSGINALAAGADGRLWFATASGISWIDANHLVRNPLPPPVDIKTVKADGVDIPVGSAVTLQAGISNLQIDYTAASLPNPKRMQFRYRLEGFDKDWVNPGLRRQAFYTNLSPGAYTFRVKASNNDGVWNETGAKLDFVIPPTFVQTRWFIALCALGAAAAIWLLARMHFRQLAVRMRERFEERMAERERIARELHDTLLQSTQGLILSVQAATYDVSPDDPARKKLEHALEHADEIMAEGRDRILDLRIAEDMNSDLPSALAAVGDELAKGYTADFRVIVEGSAQALNPNVRDEVYHIGRETLLNAFRHAQAKSIEVRIIYAGAELHLRIRDDGVGIDTAADASSRPGHWGLQGMRERAQKIGAQIDISSPPESGTEIELRIPAATAYQERTMVSRWLSIRRMVGGRP